MANDAGSILIVDDDRELSRTVSDILDLHGYPSVAAATGAEGIELAAREEKPIPVALVDLGLPDMGGLEVVSELHRIAALTEIVILTGNASLDSAIAALREDSYDYLVKPVAPQHLVSTVERGVRRWEHRKAEEELFRNRERFQLVVEALSDVVTVVFPDGTIQYQSPSAERVLGYGPGELAGEPFLRLVSAADRSTVEKAFAEAAEDSSRERPFEFHFETASGKWRLMEGVARRLHGEENSPVVITSRDITERRRLEQELLQSQKMESIGRLAGGVAHDFNNQLTAIMSSASLAAWDEAVPESVLEELDEIRMAAQRAAQLTRQLLIFSRKEMDRPRSVDLNTLVEDMGTMLRRLIPEDLELVEELEPELPPVYVDPTQMEQVLLNLVVNARDAMSREGTGSRIVVRTRVGANSASRSSPDEADSDTGGGSRVIMEVEDEGEGMTDEVLDRIFEPFFTTKEPGTGTGLGLATSYGIVERAGGTIRVRSEVETGTVFEVLLPPAPPSSETSESTSDDQELPPPGSGGETILLVEDDDGVRGVMTRILERDGYRVLGARKGTEALELLSEHGDDVDLLLTDLVMPKMSGVEVAEAVRARQPQIGVLYTSGYADDQVLVDGGLPFGADLVTKPVDAAELIRRVRRALARG